MVDGAWWLGRLGEYVDIDSIGIFTTLYKTWLGFTYKYGFWWVCLFVVFRSCHMGEGDKEHRSLLQLPEFSICGRSHLWFSLCFLEQDVWGLCRDCFVAAVGNGPCHHQPPPLLMIRERKSQSKSFTSPMAAQSSPMWPCSYTTRDPCILTVSRADQD